MVIINYPPSTARVLIELESNLCAASVYTEKDVVTSNGNNSVSIDTQVGGEDFTFESWD